MGVVTAENDWDLWVYPPTVDLAPPAGITVTPSYALSILDEYAAQGLDPRQSPE